MLETVGQNHKQRYHRVVRVRLKETNVRLKRKTNRSIDTLLPIVGVLRGPGLVLSLLLLSRMRLLLHLMLMLYLMLRMYLMMQLLRVLDPPHGTLNTIIQYIDDIDDANVEASKGHNVHKQQPPHLHSTNYKMSRVIKLQYVQSDQTTNYKTHIWGQLMGPVDRLLMGGTTGKGYCS